MQVAIAGVPGAGTDELLLALRQALDNTGMLGCEVCLASDLIHAIEQDLLFEDTSHYSAALEYIRGFELTVLNGLDPIGTGLDTRFLDPMLRARFDAKLRQALNAQGLHYAVVLGSLHMRCDTALQAITHASVRSGLKVSQPEAAAWHWDCECCSDADGERQLFTRLLKSASVRP